MYERSLGILLLSMKRSYNPQFQPIVCLFSLKQWDKYHFHLISCMIWDEKEVHSGNHCFRPFLLFFMKRNFRLYLSLLMVEGQPCSTSANHITWPSIWPSLNPFSCLKMKSYLCHLSKSLIYSNFHNETIRVATRKHKVITYFGLLSFKVTYLQSQLTES